MPYPSICQTHYACKLTDDDRVEINLEGSYSVCLPKGYGSQLIATHNRTFICSVVFIDIVDYSTKTVEQQIKIKAQLNRFTNEATKNVAFNDRIIIDTGDGAAICFLGDPEDALFVAMHLRDAIASAGQSAEEPLLVRFGINLGPVKLVKDINDRENLIGDGINTAQRIMNFAEAGQLLVSRSYYEVVSCLTREYADLFHYIGMRADKHIREHEIYGIKQTVKPPIDLFHMETAALEKEELPIHNLALEGESGPPPPVYVSESGKGFDNIISPLVHPPEQSRRPKMLLVLCSVLVVVVIAATWFFVKRPSSDIKEAASPSQKTAPVQEPQGEISGKITSENVRPSEDTNPKPEPPPLVTSPVQESQAEVPGKEVSENARPSEDANPKPQIPPLESPPAKKSILQFAVSPWGEVYLDGKNHGASPPLTSLSITPGKHKVEIKNTSFPVYSKTFEAKPDEKLKITHKFR
jgi:class 3 adenylate cyclase